MDRPLATRSFHVLHEVLALLDGRLQLGDGFRYHLLFERGDLADAQILLDALFLEETGGDKIGQFKN